MGRNKIILLCLVLIGVSLFAFFFKGASLPPKYIFINQTSDHRFDESIRISIVASLDRTGVQNAVVITDDLDLKKLEDKAAALFSELRVGEQQKGRGILYLFSPAKKALKIEVGYSLEGVLPDVTVRGLELAAKTFIYSNRYQDFWAELINTLNIQIYEAEHGEDHRQDANFDFSKFRFLSGAAGVASRSYSPSLEQLALEFKTSAKSESVPAFEKIDQSVESYLKSLKAGVGESTLDILSEESRIFREVTPQTNYQLFRNWKMYSRAGIDRTFVENNVAFVFFKSGHPTLPLVLKKQKGKWRVEEPLSWSLFHRFENSMGVFLKFPLTGISVELAHYLEDKLGNPLYPLSKPIDLVNLVETPLLESDWHSLYFRLFWLSKVNEKIKTLSQLPTDDIWIVADTFMNLGKMTEFSSAYDLGAARMPNNQRVQEAAKFYRELIQFKESEWRLK